MEPHKKLLQREKNTQFLFLGVVFWMGYDMMVLEKKSQQGLLEYGSHVFVGVVFMNPRSGLPWG